ncbi:carcinoembryonic antigen-related cell adhesion molecule 6-like isoform X2 [Erpetoichthys calabaricus]|uniref:carcinoembryonic antigen-related cell adhesion molecule 6-like isoform X2 n=1 Tax=Erpetoichthys calabaricus TaxID=27687 RepID=UPI00223449E6|nr:carcinoembryonic antigen-related cell adhesion molecule 6-like isoform X2 [Erpetoichthys calabaricus]
MSVLFSHDRRRAKMRGASCIRCFLAAALWAVCSSLSLTTPTSPVFGRVGGDVTLNFSLNPSNVVLQTVIWRLNNNNVVSCVDGSVSYGPGYEGRVNLNTTTGSLSLFRLTLRDSGQYSVSVITTGGESTGGSVTLQVLDPVSVPTIQSNVTNPVEFNDTVTLTCTASGSDVSYQWFNGSSELSDTQRIHLSADKRTLTISGVLRSDDGPFYCYVYNHVSNGTSKPFSLDIKYGPDLPTLSVSPTTPVYAAGSSLILNCSAKSNPTAQYQWFLNGTSLNKSQELEIRKIQVDQAGNYTCWAFNDVTLRYAAANREIDVIGDVQNGNSLTTAGIVAIAVCSVLLVLAVTALVVFLLIRHRRSSTGSSKSSSPTTKPEDGLVYSTPTFLKEPGDRKTKQNADPNAQYANISKQPQVQSNTATEYAELRRK